MDQIMNQIVVVFKQKSIYMEYISVEEGKRSIISKNWNYNYNWDNLD